MSDDEEVVLQDSELHKYMQINDIGNLYANIADKKFTPGCTTDVHKKSNSSNENSVLNFNRKFKFSENAGNIICSIVNTGLLYPDHINDLEYYLDVGSIKERKAAQNEALYLSCLVVSSSMLVAFNRKFKILYYMGLTAATYFSYKVCSVVKVYYEFHKIKHFTAVVGNLFSSIKKTLSFILESEFLLKGKIVKDQPFYVSHSGWIDPNTYDGIKYSGLVLPELRKLLLTVYFDAVIAFNCIYEFMIKKLPLKSDSVANNLITFDDSDFSPELNTTIPSSEDLKKLNSVYLVTQSECLKRLIFCFVEELWVNKSSHSSLNDVVRELQRHSNHLHMYKDKLELLYKKCIIRKECNIVQVRGNTMLKSENANDKLYAFIHNFLTKADAHMLSLLLDLRMINEWINEFEENNKGSDSDYSSKLIKTFHDRLQLMNSNIRNFTDLYNDNCNILKSMIGTTSANTSERNVDAADEKLSNCTKLTGIEVGKSDFNCSGSDEVLISLSNGDRVNVTNDTWDFDCEDQISQKCMPKNVLDELKHALQGKKEEWLEREKKATLNSNITLDNLELDNLLHSNYSDYKELQTENECPETMHICISGSYQTCESNRSCSSNEGDDNSFRGSQTNINKYNSSGLRSNASRSVFSLQSNDQPDCNKNLEDSDKETSSSHTSFKFNRPSSFADQIKLAQKSFNLNMREEEFLEDYSSEEEISD